MIDEEEKPRSVKLDRRPQGVEEQGHQVYLCEFENEEAASSSSTALQKQLVVMQQEKSLDAKNDVLLISIDNKVYSVIQTKRTARSVDFLMNGKAVHAELSGGKTAGVSSSKVGAGKKSDLASVKELVSSNFPAKVVSIKVSKGQRVKEGDTMLVLEAMKMEAQIKAPRACSVVEVFVSEGEMVHRGAKLLQLNFS